MVKLNSIFALLLAAVMIQATAFGSTAQTVLLVSIDGFRFDYFDKAAAPNLLKLAANGVRAKALIPVFPTETFPSHYSMLTGLHPEEHGIVSNNMRDPSITQPFALRDRESLMNTNWWRGEPIWITAQRAGIKSATCFWPGTDVQVGGTRPTYWLPFDDNLPNEARINQICQWLALPEAQRPSFLTLYLGDVDKAGHRHGPNSPQVAEAIEQTDKWIGILSERLKGFEYLNLNLIIVSDHGMAETSHERVIAFEDYLNMDDVEHSRGGELVSIYPKLGRSEKVLEQLKRMPHATFYKREETPERLRFRKSARIAPLVGIVDEGWLVLPRSYIPDWKRNNSKGTHGYDNRYPSMHGIFIAHGPSFGTARVIDPFVNLQVHGIVCRLLGLAGRGTGTGAGIPAVWPEKD